MIAILDWKTPNKFETRAQKHTWLTRIPPVKFQETRVRFNRETKTATKSQTPMRFQKEIDLARYLHKNEKPIT